MKSVFDRFQLYWANQYETIEDDLANERIRPLHKIQIPLLQQVISYVHAFALRKIVQQKARVQVVNGAPFQPPLPCDCSTPIYMGIPCWHILFERLRAGGMVLLSDIHPHWYYDRGNAHLAVGRQIIPLLNPDIVKGKGRPKGVLGRKNNTMLPVPGVDATTRGRGRGKRGSHTRGNGKSSTRRHPSAFETDPHEFPTSTAPARLQKRLAPIDTDDEAEDYIKVEYDILPAAQQLLDTSLTEIAAGNPPLSLSTTQVALARGAGTRRDSYVPGTVRERAYMRSKSTIIEKDMGDQTLNELASNDVVFSVNISHIPPSTALARTRPQRSIKKVDWSHLLSDDDDGSGKDMANNEDFDWDV
jgi:hypothetical protein